MSKKFVYVEPAPGMNVDGTLVTCHREVRVSQSDAVKISRYMHAQHYQRNGKEVTQQFLNGLDEEKLCVDFQTINWAEEEA